MIRPQQGHWDVQEATTMTLNEVDVSIYESKKVMSGKALPSMAMTNYCRSFDDGGHQGLEVAKRLVSKTLSLDHYNNYKHQKSRAVHLLSAIHSYCNTKPMASSC